MFEVRSDALTPDAYREKLLDHSCGGFATFEGWVRDHNEGRRVVKLEYEVYARLALSEGQKLIEEALEAFGVTHIYAAHREGELALGDCAVWVGVSAAHRDEAFRACRFVIDEIKTRLPIWKKEHYTDGTSGWVSCERCAPAE